MLLALAYYCDFSAMPRSCGVRALFSNASGQCRLNVTSIAWIQNFENFSLQLQNFNALCSAAHKRLQNIVEPFVGALLASVNLCLWGKCEWLLCCIVVGTVKFVSARFLLLGLCTLVFELNFCAQPTSGGYFSNWLTSLRYGVSVKYYFWELMYIRTYVCTYVSMYKS